MRPTQIDTRNPTPQLRNAFAIARNAPLHAVRVPPLLMLISRGSNHAASMAATPYSGQALGWMQRIKLFL
jgi:hypothetical protein